VPACPYRHVAVIYQLVVVGASVIVMVLWVALFVVVRRVNWTYLPHFDTSCLRLSARILSPDTLGCVMAARHRPPRPDMDEKIKPPKVDDPEEALRRLLNGQGAKPEDWDEEDERIEKV
jgi:hypothetical protein